MNELVVRISEKLGISKDQAHKAVLITADYLKTKLPDPLYEEIEMMLEIPSPTDQETKELGLFKIP